MSRRRAQTRRPGAAPVQWPHGCSRTAFPRRSRTAAGGVVAAPARRPARAVAAPAHRTRRAAARARSGAAGVLRHRTLRPLGHADPRAGLPRGGLARTAPAAAPGGAPPQALDVRADAAPALVLASPARAVAHAGAAARWAGCASGTGCAARAGVDLRRPRAGSRERLVPRAVLRELGGGRPVPPSARPAAERPRHDRAVLDPGVAASGARRGARRRALGAQAGAGT